MSDSPTGPGPQPSLVELLVEQRQAWQRGRRVPVEEIVGRCPHLRDNAEAVLDLIYNEIVLREQAGEKPRLEEYVARFPHLSDQLNVQFELEDGLPTDGTASFRIDAV